MTEAEYRWLAAGLRSPRGILAAWFGCGAECAAAAAGAVCSPADGAGLEGG
jgi:hypothetical protein